MPHFYQGYYKLRNPDKYKGDKNSIRYMSSWEHRAHYFFDTNPNVIQWSSEEIRIPYQSPTDGRIHTYYPDYWVKYKDKNGNIHQEIVEVKPYRQTLRPKRTKNTKQSRFIYEWLQYTVNQAKWSTAETFCNKYGMEFRILTEKDLGL